MSPGPQDLDELADDYALGLLGPTETMLFEELLARDPALARRVGALRDRLLPLDLSAQPVALPAGFADRVKAKLPQDVTEPPRPSPAAMAKPRRGLAAGPSAALKLLAASLVGLLAGLAYGLIPPGPEPVVFAVLVDADGRPQAVIEDFGDDGARIRLVADISVPGDRSLQVWTLPSAEIGPTSLGLLETSGAQRLVGPDLPAPRPAQLYEITLEPRGGSPTGRPTGPIIGKGLAVAEAF